MSTTTDVADLLLCKEKEVLQLRKKKFEETDLIIKEKERCIQEGKEQMAKLVEDFNYNLKLLTQRDEELKKYDQSFALMKDLGEEQQRLLKETNLELARAEAALREEVMKLSKVESFYQQKLAEVQSALERQESDAVAEQGKLQERHRTDLKVITLEKDQMKNEIEILQRNLQMSIQEEVRKVKEEARQRLEEVLSESESLESKNKQLQEELLTSQERFNEHVAMHDKRGEQVRQIEHSLKQSIMTLSSSKSAIEVERDNLVREREGQISRLKAMEAENDAKTSELIKVVNQLKQETDNIKAVYENEQARTNKLHESEVNDLNTRIRNIEATYKQYVSFSETARNGLKDEMEEKTSMLTAKINEVKELEKKLFDLTRSKEIIEQRKVQSTDPILFKEDKHAETLSESMDSPNDTKNGLRREDILENTPELNTEMDSNNTMKQLQHNPRSKIILNSNTPNSSITEDAEANIERFLDLNVHGKHTLSFMDELLSPSALSTIMINQNDVADSELPNSNSQYANEDQSKESVGFVNDTMSNLKAENALLRLSIGNMRAEMEDMLSMNRKSEVNTDLGDDNHENKTDIDTCDKTVSLAENDKEMIQAVSPNYCKVKRLNDVDNECILEEMGSDDDCKGILIEEINGLRDEIKSLELDLGIHSGTISTSSIGDPIESLENDREQLMELSNTLRARLIQSRISTQEANGRTSDKEHVQPHLSLQLANIHKEVLQLRDENKVLTDNLSKLASKFSDERVSDIEPVVESEIESERINLDDNAIEITTMTKTIPRPSHRQKRPKTATESSITVGPQSTSNVSPSSPVFESRDSEIVVDGERKLQSVRPPAQTGMSQRETSSQKEKMQLEQKKRIAKATRILHAKRRIRNYAIREDLS